MVFWHTRAEPKAPFVFLAACLSYFGCGNSTRKLLIASLPWFRFCNVAHKRPHARVNPSGTSFLLRFFIDPCGAMAQQNTAVPLPPDPVGCFCKSLNNLGAGCLPTCWTTPQIPRPHIRQPGSQADTPHFFYWVDYNLPPAGGSAMSSMQVNCITAIAF